MTPAFPWLPTVTVEQGQASTDHDPVRPDDDACPTCLTPLDQDRYCSCCGRVIV